MEFRIIFSKADNNKFYFEIPNGFALIHEIERDYSVILHSSNVLLLKTKTISKRTITYDNMNRITVIVDEDEAKEFGVFANTSEVNVTISDDFINKFVTNNIIDIRGCKKESAEHGAYVLGPDFHCEATLNIDEMVDHWKMKGFPIHIE